jgi:hypothetical protein
MNLAPWIQFGGVVHLGILTASALTPGTLNWSIELKRLSPLSRHLIWVHGAFIVLVITGFGLLSLLLPEPLTDGNLLARCVCGFVAIFWLARLGVQFFVFDARPYLTRPLLAVGYRALTVAFAYLAIIYGLAAMP